MAEEFVDVTIQTPLLTIDVPLHARMPVRQVLGDLVSFLIKTFREGNDQDSSKYVDELAWIEDKDARWSLSTPHNIAFKASETLDSQGVYPGDTLVLRKDSVREQYPMLIDDTPVAIARYQKMHFPSWDRPWSRAMSIAALVVFAITGTGTGVYAILSTSPGWAYRAPTIAVYALLGLVFLTLSSVLAHRALSVRETVDAPLSSALGFVGYLAIASTGLLLFPHNTAWSGVIAAALLVASSVVLLRFCSDITYVHYGAAFLGSTVLIVAGIVSGINALARSLGEFEFPHNTTVTAMQMSAGAVAALVVADRLSMSLSHIPMPYVPTVGEDFAKDKTSDLSAIPLDAGSEAIESIINNEARVVAAYKTNIGFLCGGLLLALGSAVIAMSTLHTHPLVVFVCQLTVAICMIYRGRSVDDAALQATWLGAATLMMVAIAVGAAISQHWIYLAVTAGLAFAALITAMVFSLTYAAIQSPLMVHRLEIVEKVLFASIMIDIALVMDVWQTVRAH
jgi:type VII secretion integral membrane protein EccD